MLRNMRVRIFQLMERRTEILMEQMGQLRLMGTLRIIIKMKLNLRQVQNYQKQV